jgi:uncharacterized protein (TIGR02246 family)
MKKNLHKGLLILSSMGVFLLFLGLSAQADDKDRNKDEKAISANIVSYLKAYKNRDAAGVAKLWAKNAVYTSPATGQRVQGRESIQEYYQELFDTAESVELSLEVLSIRFVTEKVAVEEGTATFIGASGAPETTNYEAIHVKEDGKWLVDSVRESAATPTDDGLEKSAHYEKLKDLEWLIGEWIDEDEEGRIELSCKWTKNKNFMVRSFKVFVEERIDIEGTQVIGWDPANERFRSWLFDSHGGFGEGWVVNEGKRWISTVHATLPDGAQGSSIQIMNPIDHDSFQWSIVAREVDGEIRPNVEPVIVRRKQSNEE